MRRGGAILVALTLAAVAVAQPPVGPPGVVNGVVLGGGPPNVPLPVIAPPQPQRFPVHLLTPWWLVIVVVVVQQQKKAQEEEEEVTAPTAPEYEYKIIRSAFGSFKKPEKLRAALAEEARCGWELVEKFDDSRVRLRRPVSCRSQDADRGQDPYRTRVGASDGTVAAWIILAVLVGVGTVVGLLFLIPK